MWWKVLVVYLAAFAALLWGLYHFAKAMDGAKASVRGNPRDNR